MDARWTKLFICSVTEWVESRFDLFSDYTCGPRPPSGSSSGLLHSVGVTVVALEQSGIVIGQTF
jgi:hypothetical protein